MKRQRKSRALAAVEAQPEINLGELAALVGVGCTDAEIAAYFDMSLEAFRYRKRDGAVAGAIKRGKAKSRVFLRFKFFSGRQVVSQGLSFRKGIE